MSSSSSTSTFSTLGSKALQVLRTVAPTVATAIGGPLGGIAATAVMSLFGTTDQKSTEDALLAATPDQLVALKKVEDDFTVQMKQLGVQEEQLQFADIASARAREASVKDWTPAVLAYGVTLGFFGVLGWMLFKGVPRDSGGDVLLVMLGSLGTAWTGIVSYYFGSSTGAQKNAETIAQIAKQP